MFYHLDRLVIFLLDEDVVGEQEGNLLASHGVFKKFCEIFLFFNLLFLYRILIHTFAMVLMRVDGYLFGLEDVELEEFAVGVLNDSFLDVDLNIILPES